MVRINLETGKCGEIELFGIVLCQLKYSTENIMMAMIIILLQVKKLLGSDLPWEYLSFDINFYPPSSTLDVKLIGH